jgi:hypothetical protein
MNYFYITESHEEAIDFLRSGFTCKKSDDDFKNVLGNSEHGIHLVRNLDAALKYHYSKKIDTLYVIIVEVNSL